MEHNALAAGGSSEHQRQTALVTGAAGAIGGATAAALRDAGFRVAAHDLAHVRERADLLLTGDITKAPRAAVQGSVEHFGTLDVLIHCAGGGAATPFLQMSDDDWADSFALNATAGFQLCQEAARHMATRGTGVIVVITSLCARMAWRGFAHYCSSKAALEMLCRSMAVELAEHGIRVNALVPGTIDTPLTDATGMNSDDRDRLVHRTPMGRLGRPQEVAAAAVWLATAPAFVTGEALVVDGGYQVEGTP